MQRLLINLLLILFNWSLLIDTKSIVKGPSNETLLIGQINGPSSGTARNLLGMVLSMNVVYNNTTLHSSLIHITESTFPLNYSIILANKDLILRNVSVISMIWQPAYIYEGETQLSENKTDIFNFDMHKIKLVTIRGEIVHEKHSKGDNVSSKQIKLEIIENEKKGRVIDQIDFLCKSKKYPCPFEYWLDTSRLKANTEYKLQAFLADGILPSRKFIHQKHHNKTLETKSTSPTTFQINPSNDTELNDYQITVGDSE